MVDPCGCGDEKLCVLLGYGRREPGVRRYGSGDDCGFEVKSRENSLDEGKVGVTKTASDAKSLVIRAKEECKWDLVSLGEVMLRLDPGDLRVATARQFNVWEGGGEYNVARGLKRCFGLKTAIVTALADNPVG